MRALVTGGAGFIGSHIADALLLRGYDVRVVDNLEPRVHPRGVPSYLSREVEFCAGDIRDKRVVERALLGVDIIFHHAAYQDYMPDYSKFFHSNVVSTALLFEVVREKGLPVQKCIVSSSQAVYGEGQYNCPEHGFCLPPARPVEQLDRGDWDVRCARCHRELEPLLLSEEHPNPTTPYGLSKYAEEIVALRLGRMLSIPTVGLRYSIVQGARQSFYKAYSGVCRIFTCALRHGHAPVIYEDGLQRRDYVHIDDVVRAHLLVLEDSRADYEAFNVGTGKPVTVLEYARILAKTMRVAIEPLIPGIYRRGDGRHTVSSIDKISRVGWKPVKGLEEIFADYLAWLDTVGDAGDYFTPAFEQMKQNGVVRPVRRQEVPLGHVRTKMA
ncbi:MAG: NAD-dependent epimerase/dehydratase family protein [Acidobacteria bacterium]|nr:NAD-dependent epimerase/dehydratase family protein [Acidobacteriota bacterium]